MKIHIGTGQTTAHNTLARKGMAMDERLMKSLIKALGINPDEMVEGAKKFVIDIQMKQKAIEDSLIEIQAKQNLILSMLPNCNTPSNTIPSNTMVALDFRE